MRSLLHTRFAYGQTWFASSLGARRRTSRHLSSSLRVQYLTQNWDTEELNEPTKALYFRPWFKKFSSRLHATRQNYLDPTLVNAMKDGHDGHAIECRDRFRGTGLEFYRDLSDDPPYSIEDGSYTLTNTTSDHWKFVVIMRYTCKLTFANFWTPVFDCQSRKLCAQTRDERYPDVYHSLTFQAHALYIIGRIELERDPKFRTLAWYILSVSAGLGQLDAALLLHQLEKHDPRQAVQSDLRAMLAKAARESIDWRAMVAHCEHMYALAKGRSGKGRLQALQLDQCLTTLETAMSLTGFDGSVIERIREIKDGYLDAEHLERFDAPYKLLTIITAAEIAAGNRSERVTKLFEKATINGAMMYQDPKAAWQYAQWSISEDMEYTPDLVECLRLAAQDANADACFQYAKFCLKRDLWDPSLTKKVLEDERLWVQETSGDEDKDIHETIIQERGRDKNLLKSQDGLYWMKMSAQLHINSATKMLNRYCIVAGLLRQNGYLDEGREVLLEAKQQLSDCVDNPAAIKRALVVLDEFLEFWDKRRIHQLLDPDSIAHLLDPIQKT